jgi:hypothetical protein
MGKPSRRRMFQAGVLALAGIASLWWGGYQWWLRTPPPMPDTVEQAIETFKSERFRRLPETRQEAYYERSRQLFERLDGDRRRELRVRYENDSAAREAVSSAMLTMVTQQARKFITMEPNQRQVVLDGFIAMQELGARRHQQRQAERQAQGQSNDDPDRQRRRAERMDDARQRIETWVEQGNPQRQAYLSEFFKALRERRIERGLPPEPDFPGRH